jgi:hypothetical protein
MVCVQITLSGCTMFWRVFELCISCCSLNENSWCSRRPVFVDVGHNGEEKVDARWTGRMVFSGNRANIFVWRTCCQFWRLQVRYRYAATADKTCAIWRDLTNTYVMTITCSLVYSFSQRFAITCWLCRFVKDEGTGRLTNKSET